MRKNDYTPRLIDRVIKEYLKVFGAISVEGPKWCGKTWTSLNHAESVVFLDDLQEQQRAELDLNLILNRKAPELIDEWTLVPQVWDAVRHLCDMTCEKGNYILTCSTRLTDVMRTGKVYHSGAGRIGKIRMRTMSLLESGDSTGAASIEQMRKGKLKNQVNTGGEKNLVKMLADRIERGGWPSNQNTSEKNARLVPRSYIEAVLDTDIHDDKQRNRDKMQMLLRSLARNESSLVTNRTLLRDVGEHASEDARIVTEKTLDDYLDVLKRLYIIEDQPAYTENYRSPERVGKAAKRHFTDPSLACAVLGITQQKLIKDLNTFGLMFEALVERDLRVYMDIIGGTVRHFRDNVSGQEVDAILEFDDGGYAAVEIKLGMDKVEEAKKNLVEFREKMMKAPDFMCIVVGNTDVIVRDKETGVYIVPVTALGV